jgi:hypothetical protein
MCGFIDSLSRIHFNVILIVLTRVVLRRVFGKISCSFYMLYRIPGKPLGPGTPEGPGGPIGPGGPGVKVDSRTAVVSAKTFTKKTVSDKHLHKCGFITCKIPEK